jgi:hypothetical protein
MLSIGDMVMPHYWSNLFLAMRSMLIEADYNILKEQIIEVCKMCGVKNEKTYDDAGDLILITNPTMTLYEIETYLFNSWNLKSYFLVEGRKITQFEIERKLFEIKQFCYTKMFEIQGQILFTKPPIRM